RIVSQCGYRRAGERVEERRRDGSSEAGGARAVGDVAGGEEHRGRDPRREEPLDADCAVEARVDAGAVEAGTAVDPVALAVDGIDEVWPGACVGAIGAGAGVDDVVSPAAVDDVVSAAAEDRVASAEAADDVSVSRAAEGVVACRALDRAPNRWVSRRRGRGRGDDRGRDDGEDREFTSHLVAPRASVAARLPGGCGRGPEEAAGLPV